MSPWGGGDWLMDRVENMKAGKAMAEYAREKTKEQTSRIEMLEEQLGAALEAAEQGLTWRPGAPGGWEVTDPHKLVMVWGYLAAARSLSR